MGRERSHKYHEVAFPQGLRKEVSYMQIWSGLRCSFAITERRTQDKWRRESSIMQCHVPWNEIMHTHTSHRFLGEGGSCEYSTSRKKYGDVHSSSCAWQGMGQAYKIDESTISTHRS